MNPDPIAMQYVAFVEFELDREAREALERRVTDAKRAAERAVEITAGKARRAAASATVRRVQYQYD